MPQPRRRRCCPVLEFTHILSAMLCLGLLHGSNSSAATDQIVVDEFLVRCLDGTTNGAFVELTAAGPNQTFEANMGLRVLGPSGGTLADLPGIFAPLAGQTWTEGRRFLFAVAGFEGVTGVAPDFVLQAAPSSASGSILLYLPRTGGTIQVLRRVDYSSSGLVRTPAAGRSAQRTPESRYFPSPDASPTRSDGVLARAPGCFADARRPIFIQELATRCGGGQPSGGFVEISTITSGQSLDSDLMLRALDHAGAVVFDVPLGFGSLEGSGWISGRAWFAAAATFTNSLGEPPNLVLPAPLDTAGGRVILHGRNALGEELILSEVVYGTPQVPSPTGGASLVWDAFVGRYVLRSPATPFDYFGRAHTPSDCTSPSSVRVRELLTSCGPLAPAASYVELLVTAAGERFDSTLALEIRDVHDTLLAVVPSGFGARSGTAWDFTVRWLFATPEITDVLGSRADVLLPVPLDTRGGRVDVVRAPPGVPNGREVIQTLRWGAGLPTPLPGQALTRTSDTVYPVTNNPSPRTSTGAALRCPVPPPPPDTAIVVPVHQAEVCTGCWDGSRQGQFVRLGVPTGALLDTSFNMRVYNRQGVLLGVRLQVFKGTGFTRTTSSRSWLVADPSFGELGEAMDALLPAPLDPVGGAIEVAWERDDVRRAIWRYDYGSRGLPLPPYGYSQLSGAPPITILPTAVSWSGVTHTKLDCHFTGSAAASSMYFSELFPACEDGSTGTQYVTLTGVDPTRRPDPRLSLEVRDRLGLLRETITSVIPDPIPPSSGAGARTLLVGSPDFARLTGFTPDATLGLPLDPSGGSVQLVLIDNVVGLRAQIAGANWVGGVSPPAGRALVQTPGQPIRMRRELSPVRLDGERAEIPPGCADASPKTPVRLHRLALGCFDGDPRGQFVQLITNEREDSLTTDYALVLRDHDDHVIGEVAPAFGNHIGLPIQANQGLLIAHPDAPLPIAPDATLPVPLDTLGGSLTLVDRNGGGERVVWSQRYGGNDAGTFLLGNARHVIADGTWLSSSTLLFNWAAQSGYLLGCHRGTLELAPVVLRGVLGSCGDGATASSYVELSVTANVRSLFGLSLQVSDGLGSTSVPLFPDARAFEIWPAGRSLLIANDGFEAATGVRPDRRLARPFGDRPASITVRKSEGGSNPALVLAGEAFDFYSRPQPGRALERSGPLMVSTAQPRPTTFDGVTHDLGTSCFLQPGLPDSVRIAGVLLACADDDPGAQYVQLDRTSLLATRDPDLRVRLFDREGGLLGQRGDLFPAGDNFWGAPASLVLGGPDFQDAFGIPADAPLPAELDRAGGVVQLVRARDGVDHVLSELRYGPGGVALPPPSSALVWQNGSWTADSLPRPNGFAGIGTGAIECLSRCEPNRVMLSFGQPRLVAASAAGYTDSYSEVRFNIASGELEVSSRHLRSELLASDLYTLEGSDRPDTLDATIDLIEEREFECIGRVCEMSTRRLHLLVDGVVLDSLALSVSGRSTLRARVPFRPGDPTRVQILAATHGRLTPSLAARVTARLSFSRPAAGTRLVSCRGYDSERARVVHEPEWSAGSRQVTVQWPVMAAPGFTADVQRLDEAADPPVWERRETRPVEPNGVVRFVDPFVLADRVYRYRLAWSDPWGAYTSDEVRVTVPRSAGFFLFAPKPNPSHGSLTAEFELPEASEAVVELFDVAGRRVAESRAQRAFGMHSVSFGSERRLAPGVYTVRLRAGGRESNRVVIVLP